MKQNNPINGLRIVDNNQQIQNLPEENQVRDKNTMFKQNSNVIRIIGTNNRDNRRDAIRTNNSNDNEINIDEDSNI